MDQKFLSQKWFLISYVIVTALLILNTALDTCWFLGADYRIQFGSDRDCAIMFALGWVAPVLPLLVNKSLLSELIKIKKIKILGWLFVLSATVLSLLYTCMLWTKGEPVVALNYEPGGQLRAYEGGLLLGDSSTYIEQKKMISTNVFWIRRLHFEPNSCDVKMKILPNHILKCAFVKGFWQKEAYSEILLKY